MDFKILQEDLANALSIVSRFVSSRPQLPVLANILFSANKGNKLLLVATNLEIGIQVLLDAKVEKEGQLALPAKDINEFISYLSPGKIHFSSDKNMRMTLNSKSGKSIFAGMDASEFPKMPVANEALTISLPIDGIKESFEKIGFAAASDDTRPVLAAINWQFQKNGYRMVATDGYRLSLKDVKNIKSKLKKKDDILQFLIPARSLAEVVRLTKGDEIKVGLTSDSNQVVFLMDQIQLSSRLIEGDYPDYQKILPKEAGTKVTIDKVELLQAIKTASVFARNSGNIVKLDVKKDFVSISANAAGIGENKTNVDAKIEGESLEIAFNYRFVIDLLSAIRETEKEVMIELTESLAPGLFKIASDPDWLHLIMPVRVEN